MMRSFRFAKGYRPKATRDVSREMFVVARGLKAIYRQEQHPPEQADSSDLDQIS